jgi:hypothetical protein
MVYNIYYKEYGGIIMEKGIRRDGVCIEYIKNDEVLTNCFYNLDLNIVEIIKLIMDLVTNYNELNLVNSDKEDDIIAVSFFENKKDSNNKYLDIKSCLMEESLENILELYDENFSKKGDGRIAYNETDKDLNESEAGILVRIYIDERKIYIEDFEFYKIFMEKFVDQNPEINIDNLDCFEYDLKEFNFYDLKDILDFLEKHFINSKESYFKIAEDSKFLYSITINDTKKEYF